MLISAFALLQQIVKMSTVIAAYTLNVLVKTQAFRIALLTKQAISSMPELLGNWYTRPAVNCGHSKGGDASSVIQCVSDSTDSELTSADTSNPSEPSYCYCRGPEEGTMIACRVPY